MQIKTHEADDHKDHDYLGNGSEDEGDKPDNSDPVRISIRKKSYDVKKERQCRGDTEKNLLRICVICGRRVRRKRRIAKVPLWVEDQDGFKCRKCVMNRVPCELCGKMVKLLRMKRHMKVNCTTGNENHWRSLRQCHGECGKSECRKIFRGSDGLRRHHEIKHDPQTCHICGYVGKSISAMKTHLLSHDSNRSRCPHCFTYYLTDGIEEHKKKCEEQKMSVCMCNICGSTFKGPTGPSNLQSHIRRWHEVHEPKHKCSKCDKTFLEALGLKRHMESHEDKTPCPECGLKVRNLKLHMKVAHTPDDQKPFQCPDCGKGFLDKRTLGHHRMNVHLKLRPYNCRYGCDIAYNDTSNRNQHEKKNHGKLFTTEKEEKAKYFNAVT